MTLSEKQGAFTYQIALLILYADARGYYMTFGDAYRSPAVKYGHPRSLHRKRLAVDFNLFRKDNPGVLLRSTEAHRELGEYWESLGGTWGGRFNDGNHYSHAHGGMK